MRRPVSSKPSGCTEGMVVDAAGISVKVRVHYRRGLSICQVVLSLQGGGVGERREQSRLLPDPVLYCSIYFHSEFNSFICLGHFRDMHMRLRGMCRLVWRGKRPCLWGRSLRRRRWRGPGIHLCVCRLIYPTCDRTRQFLDCPGAWKNLVHFSCRRHSF